MTAVTAVIVLMAAALGCTNSAVPHGQSATASGVIHVGGKVLCHDDDCTQGYDEWVSGFKPFKGVKVSLTCKDGMGRVMYYRTDLTDEQGRFDMIVDKYINGMELNPGSCRVRIVSLPESACNILTHWGGGKAGVKLTQASSIDGDTYMAAPFYYTTPMCEKP